VASDHRRLNGHDCRGLRAAHVVAQGLRGVVEAGDDGRDPFGLQPAVRLGCEDLGDEGARVGAHDLERDVAPVHQQGRDPGGGMQRS
jgi:hypothetical protein